MDEASTACVSLKPRKLILDIKKYSMLKAGIIITLNACNEVGREVQLSIINQA